MIHLKGRTSSSDPNTGFVLFYLKIQIGLLNSNCLNYRYKFAQFQRHHTDLPCNSKGTILNYVLH